MDSEKLHVKLGISGTYHDKVPHYQILLNDVVIQEGDITSPTDVVEYLEFDVEYATEEAVLGIRLTNKEDSDVLKDSYEDPNVYNIIGDMLLNIVSVEIDELDLGNLVYKNGLYTVDTPVDYNGETTSIIKNCMTMGWKGTWTLTWKNPFYIWMLENI